MRLIKLANLMQNKLLLEYVYDHFKLIPTDYADNYIENNILSFDNNYSFGEYPITESKNLLEFFDDSNKIHLTISKNKININESKYLIISNGIFIGQNIPNLYWCTYKQIKNYNPLYKGYEFLKDAIIDLFKFEDTYFDFVFKNFIKRNKSRVDRITSSIEINPPKKLGAGVSGVAFLIAKDKVLKIFTGEDNYKHVLFALNNLHKNNLHAKYEPMIYDVGRIGKFNGIDLFFSIMEKVSVEFKYDGENEYTDKLNYIKNEIYDKYIEYTNTYGTQENLTKDFLNEVTDYIKTNLEQEQIDDFEEIKEAFDIKENLDSFIENISLKMHSNRKDLHLENLGVTRQRTIRYFDPAFNKDNFNKTKFLIKELNKVIHYPITNIDFNKVRDLAMDIKNMDVNDLTLSIIKNRLVDDIYFNGRSQKDEFLDDVYGVIQSISLEHGLNIADYDIIRRI